MALSSVRIELNGEGIRGLLRSSEVQSELNSRGERVANAARSQGRDLDGEPLPVEVRDSGGSRARTTVSIDHPAGMRVEAKYRVLVRALSAARGGE